MHVARPTADQIEEELKKQGAMYDEHQIAEEPMDIDEARKETTGEDPEDGESLDIVKKIDEDEDALEHGEDYVDGEVDEEKEEEDGLKEQIPGGFHIDGDLKDEDL